MQRDSSLALKSGPGVSGITDVTSGSHGNEIAGEKGEPPLARATRLLRFRCFRSAFKVRAGQAHLTSAHRRSDFELISAWLGEGLTGGVIGLLSGYKGSRARGRVSTLSFRREPDQGRQAQFCTIGVNPCSPRRPDAYTVAVARGNSSAPTKFSVRPKRARMSARTKPRFTSPRNESSLFGFGLKKSA